MRADLARREPECWRAGTRERQYERILEARLRRRRRVRPARRPAVPERRHPLRHRPQQDAEGHRRALAAPDGQRRRLPAGMGHPWPADRAAVEKELGKDAKTLDAGRNSAPLRDHALKFVDIMRDGVQAARLPRRLGAPVPDAVEGLRGAIARQLAGFARAGSIYRDKKPVHWCLAPQDRAGRGRDRVQGPHLASIYVRFPVVGDRGKADPRLRGQARRLRDLDDDPVDAARQPGDRRQPRARLRRASPATASTCSSRPGWPTLSLRRPASSRRRRPGSGSRARGCGPSRGRGYQAPFPPAEPAERGPPPLLRAPRDAGGRHRPRPHRPRSRRGGLHRRTRPRAAHLRSG